MERNPRHRARPVLPFGLAPQVLPALQVAEWLTDRMQGKRHKVRGEGGGKGTR